MKILLIIIFYCSALFSQSLLLFGDDKFNSGLIPNGDMELNSGWAGINTEAGDTTQQSSTLVKGGSYSWYVNVDANAEGIYNNTNSFSITNGSVYRLTAWVYIVSGAIAVIRHASIDFPENPIVAAVSTTGSWVQITGTMTAIRDNAMASIRFISTGGGARFYIDNVRIVKL